METVVVTQKMWNNIVKMLSDRGFSPKRSLKYEEFTQDHCSIWLNEKGQKLVLYLLVEQIKLQNSKFTLLLKKYDNPKYHSLVIVTKKKEMKNTADIASNCSIFVQCINYRFFNCNIVRHKDQSKTSLRDYADISNYGEKSAFPKVLTTDPLVIYYGYRVGDIIEYENSGELYWRVVT